MSDQFQSNATTKRTFWAVALFYVLIAFEFFYMASPFAFYFYSVYGPAPAPNIGSMGSGTAWGRDIFAYPGLCIGGCKLHSDALARERASLS